MAGRLTEAQRAALAEALARYNAKDLPPDLGADVKVNPHLIVLTVDGRTSKLTLPPGYALPTPVAGSAPDRLLAIAAAIKDAIGPPPQ